MPARKATPTLSSLFADVYQPAKLRGKSDNSVRLHLISIKHFARHLKREPLLSDLTDNTVAALMTWMIKARKTSARSANRLRDSILAQWRFYARKGLVKIWPDVEPLPEPERVPVAWSREELAVLFRTVRLLHGTIYRIPSALWWESLLVVLWDCGERINAASHLEWQWIDLTSGWVTFRAEIRKGQRRDIKRRLHPASLNLLRALNKASGSPRSGPVWEPTPFRTGIIYRWLRKILTSAGLPSDRYRMFHCIRKSAASHLEAAGGNATDFLDHADRRTTTRSYLDPTIVGPQQASCVLFRPEG